MKKIYFLFVFVLVVTNVIAQLPGNISYQAVIRNANNNLVTNQNIRVRLSILNAPTSTTPLWQEVQTPNTNDNGLISLQLRLAAKEAETHPRQFALSEFTGGFRYF